jgi:hypothetical protein
MNENQTQAPEQDTQEQITSEQEQPVGVPETAEPGTSGADDADKLLDEADKLVKEAEEMAKDADILHNALNAGFSAVLARHNGNISHKDMISALAVAVAGELAQQEAESNKVPGSLIRYFIDNMQKTLVPVILQRAFSEIEKSIEALAHKAASAASPADTPMAEPDATVPEAAPEAE